MKQRFLLYLLSVVTLTYSCSSRKQTDDSFGVKEIIIDPNSRQIGKLTLSNIAESLEYIPLETMDECLIGDISSSILSENYLLLYCRIARRCYLFSRSGYFIAPIGTFGQGPGEYSYGLELIQIDETNEKVILKTSNPNQLLYYDFKGRFIESVPLDIISGNMSYHNSFYLIKTRNDGNTPYSYTLLNEDFNIVTQTIVPIPFTTIPAGSSSVGGVVYCQYIYDNRVHVRENLLNDTLYMINQDYSIIPKYIINAGKYDFTVDIRSNSNLFLSEFRTMTNYLIVNSLFETKDFVLVSYRFSTDLNIPCYYSKHEDKLFYFTSISGITNDYDGGLDFWPQYQFNNQLIAFHHAFQIDEQKGNSNKLKPSGTSEAINRYAQLLQKIDAEDNPVMVIVNLKK